MADITHRDEVISKTDIPALCTELVPGLRVRGVEGQAMGRCPFHNDKTPSFSVNTITGAFNCKGCGATGNGIIDLLMKVRSVEFKEAMQELERRAGIIATINNKPRITGRYEYYDESGVLSYWKERIEPGRDGRSKEFLFNPGFNSRSTGHERAVKSRAGKQGKHQRPQHGS